jgi:hypothetical protein
LDLIIGERIIDMNKPLKNVTLIVTAVLLLAACGPFDTTPVPEPVIENPTHTSVPLVVSEPTKTMPTAASDVLNPEQYIGLQYPPSPAGLSQDFSMLIENSDVYSLSLVNDGRSKMLWLSKITHYDTNSGNPFWEVKDVIGLSDLEPGLTLIPDGCQLNGVPDSEILAAGRNKVIVYAWRANTSLGKFEAIAVDGIRCSSDKAMEL